MPGQDETLGKLVEELILPGFDSAIAEITAEGVLMPMLLAVEPGRDGELVFRRVLSDTAEQAVHELRASINKESQFEMAAILYDGLLQLDGEQFDAVIIESEDKSSGARLAMAQPYRLSGPGEPPETLGEPGILPEPGPLFD